MKLQTIIPIKKEERNLINYNSKIFLVGSCFSENIGSKFQYLKFNTTINPLGILFNPIAIENFVCNSINESKVVKEDLVFNNDLWHFFGAHSKFSSEKKFDILDNINSEILKSNTKLKESSHIIITLGTAWVYRHIETDKIVANCHKFPQKKFLKEILSIEEISESLQGIISLIKDLKNNPSIIFTVSPVRHIKDGFVENQRSKAHLIAAIHQVINKRENTHYFPSYEIMMDELRNYRFYKEDMIHPNETAINYIWNKFIDTWISDENLSTMKQIENIQKGLNHKPFNTKSKEYKSFLENLENKKKDIKNKYPFINF